MSPAVLAALATVLAAVLTGTATYLIAARRLSGRIKTTEADRLWAEANALREEYKNVADALRVQSADLRAEIENCRARISVLEHDNERLHDENNRLQRRVEELVAENTSLKLRIKELERNA